MKQLTLAGWCTRFALCVALATLPVGAAGPFRILRSGAAATLIASPPRATVATSPFDDSPGLLVNGALYYYAVLDAGNASLRLSAHKNTALGTVRIAFDDGNAFSAPVDPDLSDVEVSTTTAPADGVTIIEIRIVPRDADGTPLGVGLHIELDPNALWPATLAGPIVDNGDGSYSVRVVSILPGTVEAYVTVEGVTLTTHPELTFEDLDGLTLRELAIRRLQSLTAPGGPFSQVLIGLDLSVDPGLKLASARDKILKTLDDLYAFDDNTAVKDLLDSGINHLVNALEAPGANVGGIELLIKHVLDSGRMLALYHINLGVVNCGECGQGGPTALCQAEAALAEGDAERYATPPDYKGAAIDYGIAVTKSLDLCN